MKGLQNKVKRHGLSMHMKEKFDVICLQETHSDQSVEQLWYNEFHGQVCWSHGSSNARGVAIEVIKSFPDTNGRLVSICFCSEGEK